MDYKQLYEDLVNDIRNLADEINQETKEHSTRIYKPADVVELLDGLVENAEI